MGALDQDIARAKELFSDVGAISSRKMFGGAAIYADGRIFALVLSGQLMIKADIVRAPNLVEALEAEGAERWRYEKSGGAAPVAMPYWTLPDSAYDDPEIAADWARRSLASTS